LVTSDPGTPNVRRPGDNSPPHPPLWDRGGTIIVVIVSLPLAAFILLVGLAVGGLDVAEYLVRHKIYNQLLVDTVRLASALIPPIVIVAGDNLGIVALAHGRRGFWYALGGLLAGIVTLVMVSLPFWILRTYF
jgi:hypothetical protein